MAYIGKSPTGTGVRSRYYYTATGGETSLSGADDNSNTLVFSDGNYVDVSLNGIALVAGTDYNTSTANTISGLSALSSGDIVEVVVYDIFTVADTVSAKDGGTFSGNVAMGGTLSVTGESTATGGLNVGTIKDATGTTTAMTIDSSGLTTIKPVVPAFSVYRNSNQAISSGTWTKVQFNAEKFDTDNFFDSTTNYRFTPTIAGYYQITGSLYPVSDSSAGYIWMILRKNGTDIAYGTSAGATGPQDGVSQVNALIEFNGSTDYIEAWCYVTGTNPVLVGSTSGLDKTALMAFLVRAT